MDGQGWRWRAAKVLRETAEAVATNDEEVAKANGMKEQEVMVEMGGEEEEGDRVRVYVGTVGDAEEKLSKMGMRFRMGVEGKVPLFDMEDFI